MQPKKLYNYKKALNMPYMVQKIWKDISLENPLEVMKIVVFFGTFLSLFTIFKPVMNLLGFIPGLNIALYILLPIVAVMVYTNVEPDGLKIPQYISGVVTYYLTFRLGRKKISQDVLINDKLEKIECKRLS